MYGSERLIIGVIGSSKPDKELETLAENVGRELANKGITVICGGLTGVMEACCRGAKEAGGLTIGILPGTSGQDANPYVDIAIPTGIGEARNLVIIRSSHTVIAIGGGYGTLSEMAFALKLKVPVIGLKTWDLNKINKEDVNIIPASSAKEAVEKAILERGRRG